ncbi:aldo/keto reductase [Salegentibacter sp. HM20]
MKKRQLGTTSIEIPPIIFGGNVFGWTLSEKESFEMLDRLYELGFDCIDTADVYSRWADGVEGGTSERIIGKWMKERGNRDKMSIFTKVGSSMQQGGPKNVSKTYILKAAEDSLSRLQTDYIDLYLTHYDDEKSPVEETLEAYQKLIEQGKVRHIGASNISAERLLASLETSDKKDWAKYEVLQPEYNLVGREQFDGALAKIAREHHLAVTPYFALASGFLTGKYKTEADFKKGDRKQFAEKYFNEKGLRILEEVESIAKTHKTSNAAIALAWLIQHPDIAAPIASATKASHLEAFEDAVNLKLSSAEIQKLTLLGE